LNYDFLTVILFRLFFRLTHLCCSNILIFWHIFSNFRLFVFYFYRTPQGKPFARYNKCLSLSNSRLDVAAEKTSKPPFVAPSSVGAAFHARSDTRSSAVCHSMQLSRAVLYLSVLACLPASLTARLYACTCACVRACTCARTRCGVPSSRYKSRLLSPLPPLTHSVLVVAYACCSIHKRIETCGGTNATLHVGVEDRACKTMRMCRSYPRRCCPPSLDLYVWIGSEMFHFWQNVDIFIPNVSFVKYILILNCICFYYILNAFGATTAH